MPVEITQGRKTQGRISREEKKESETEAGKGGSCGSKARIGHPGLSDRDRLRTSQNRQNISESGTEERERGSDPRQVTTWGDSAAE